ncbi:MAG: secondary thiamine-phosphate synthase enzyme YjbQ [Methanomassiliicoccales archaeon]
MDVFRKVIELETEGEVDMRDLTGEVRESITSSGLSSGLACAFVPGSTGALITVEYEEGLKEDIRAALERLFPKGMDYEHHKRWGDGNGHSHVRASFLSPSVTIPFHDGVPDLGTWQQVVFVELDNRPRSRRIIIQVIGQ